MLPSRYQFTHALIQETLAEELSLTRRVRLHARIAEALEELYGEDSRSARGRARPSLRRSPDGSWVGQACPLLPERRASRRSPRTAHEQALAHFERALATREDQVM